MNLPELFKTRMKSLLGEAYAAFESALHESAPVSVRLNDKMPEYIASDDRVEWCDTGYYLPERPLFTADPLLHAGVYYVQEASSMFLQQIIDRCFPAAERVLDLCAAPGGKSTLLRQCLPDNCLLVSNEINYSRSMILAENLVKWGGPNVIVTNNNPADFRRLPSCFDAIVIDAPCSGEGMFRKDPGAIVEWSIDNVNKCVVRQRNILEEVWPALQTGGILVYSTCTWNREENEENIAWICETMGAERVLINTETWPGIVETDQGYRFYPHRVRGEGFFVSVLRKTSNEQQVFKPKSDTRQWRADKSGNFEKGLKGLEEPIVLEKNDQLKAFSNRHLTTSLFIDQQLNCIENGLLLATRKGKDLIPAHVLALSKQLNRNHYESIEVDYPTAISFLKRENLLLPDAPKGYLLICYKDQALGWVKNLGNRCNNLYPQHWRIRMKL